MAETLFEGKRAISLGSVEGEEDLKPIPGRLNINPPPEDVRCDCCGRRLSELRPFGKAGDPLVGDFDGALLVKRWRSMAPPDAEAERIYEDFFGKFDSECATKADFENARRMMIEEYGEEKTERIICSVNAAGCTGSSWECRDCIVLDIFEYFEKLRVRYSKKS